MNRAPSVAAVVTTVCLWSSISVSALAQTLLLRQPSISSDTLVFVYAGDIWAAGRDGGNPRRVTSAKAEENQPRLSPDGSMIAFAANFEGNTDVYVVATAGGQPKRLTWHPATDTPMDWTRDGKSVLFVSPRESDHGRSGQLYVVSTTGGLPVKQMRARIVQGTYDSAERNLAYIPYWPGYNGLFGGGAGWRGYRGGSTPAIQIMNTRANTVTIVPGAEANNFNPFWLDDNLYFLSDRDDKVINLYRYDGGSDSVAKVTNEDTWDIRSASGADRSVVYEAGGRLKEIDLTTSEVSEIVVDINPDLPQLRTQWKNAAKTIQAAHISPTGKRSVITARGEVFTVPVDEGSTRNITNSEGVREYTAHWSPDGTQIAYIVESGSGQTLVVKGQTGTGDSSSFDLGSHFYRILDWAKGSPGRIVYADNHLGLHTINLTDGQRTHISTEERRGQLRTSISSDGRWLAYTREQLNFHTQLYLYNFESGVSTSVTDGFVEAGSPAFSLDGQYLYFTASTNAGPIQVGLNMTSQEKPYRAGIYALVLAADGASPLLPGQGDEEADDESEVEENGDSDDEDKEDAPATTIALEDIASRIVPLPVAQHNYDNLRVTADGNLFYLQGSQPGAWVAPPDSDTQFQSSLMRFDFEEKKAESVAEGVVGFGVSANGKHLILAKMDGSLATAEAEKEVEPENLDLAGLRLLVDPRKEWSQIFDEAWRMESEFFYAENMHGLDWQAVYDQYRPLLEHAGRREDLNALIIEMIAEMQVGHNRIAGGDIHSEQKVPAGLLGANLEINRDRYRLARVYTGESWNPFLKAPLATPGNEARAGEYILAVNGTDLTAGDNIHQRLQGSVGKQVTLRVGPNANGREAREIIVEPVDNERGIRLWSWIESNRRFVDQATDSRVGYIYLPNTAGAGYTFFNRMFFPQVDKQAMIIDERSNGGGQAANYIIEVLSREHLSGWQDRNGKFFNTPAGAIHGPKVMLIDQDAGSGGDYLPWAFRQVGIGKLIGTRTWGGLIGISSNPPLVDGGLLVVPFFRFFDPDGNWSVENEGVEPDIEVQLDPLATNEGRDTQLERAISEVLTQLDSYQPQVPEEAPELPSQLGE